MAIQITPEKTFEDYIREINEELNRTEENYRLLSEEIIYEGNSVQWWHSKATAYKRAIEEIWSILDEYGIKADGNTHISVYIRQLLENHDV